MNTPRTIRLSSEDNVVVAVDQIATGAVAAGVTARERVPRGHKMAVSAIREGEPVRKYGQTIGFASKAISPGEWVHEQNVAMRDFARDYKFAEAARNDETVPPELRATFEGYVRPNGRTGTRNYIGILTSVNCSASVAKFIAEEVNRSGILDGYPEIDGAVAFVHGSGCGMAAYGEGWELLRRTQWGYATHPNLGAALMVGLGCEVFQIDRMKEEYGRTGCGTHQGHAARRGARQKRNTTCLGDRTRAPVRRIRRLFRHHRKSLARIRRRSSGQAWRDGGARRNARDLRCGAFTDPARHQSRRRRKTCRAHPLVGGLHKTQ